MSKFKVGDRVRRINSDHPSGDSLKIGGEGVVTAIGPNGRFRINDEMDFEHSEVNLEPVAPSPSPIRTRTVTEIVPDQYGSVLVGKHDVPAGLVQLELLATSRGFMRDASELRALSDLAAQLADALDGSP